MDWGLGFREANSELGVANGLLIFPTRYLPLAAPVANGR